MTISKDDSQRVEIQAPVYGQSHEKAVNVYSSVFEDMGVELLAPPEIGYTTIEGEQAPFVKLVVDFADMDDAYFAMGRGRAQIKALDAFTKMPVEPTPANEKTTIVVNMFGGPGAGKTTAALEVAEKLKKAGYVVEYAPEFAKELVWDMNSAALQDWEQEQARMMLSGRYEYQTLVYAEQLKRIKRCIGQCDFVVTDSPAILSCAYLKEDYPQQREDFERMAFNDYRAMNNFNMIVERGKDYEQAGRVQDAAEAAGIDSFVSGFLDKNGIYFGTYNHSQIDKAIENMRKTHARISKIRGAVADMKAARDEREAKASVPAGKKEDAPQAVTEGQLFHYDDTDHKGPSYGPWDDLSGTYKIIDASNYPDSVKVALVESDTGQSPGTSAIYRFDEQVASGEICFVDSAPISQTENAERPFPAPSMLEARPLENGVEGCAYEYRCSGEGHTYELTFEHSAETDDWFTRIYIDDGKLGKPSETACFTSLHATFKDAYNRAYERVCEEVGFVKVSDPREAGKTLHIDRVFADPEISQVRPLEPGTNDEPIIADAPAASVRHNPIAR